MPIIPLHHPYRRLNHFKEYLNELQGLKNHYFDDKCVDIIKSYFEKKSQLTYDDLKRFLQIKSAGITLLKERGFITGFTREPSPKLLDLLGGPWEKYVYNEGSKLILLANRFDPNSIFYRIPVDVAR